MSSPASLANPSLRCDPPQRRHQPDQVGTACDRSQQQALTPDPAGCGGQQLHKPA